MFTAFSPTADANLDGINKDTNYGAYTVAAAWILFIGGSKAIWFRELGKFDISSLTGQKINSATLVIPYSGVESGEHLVWVARCKRTDWTEDGVTWNKYDGTNAWAAAGGDPDTTTPPRIGFSTPSSAKTVRLNLLAHVNDALLNRSGIVSLLVWLADETAGANRGGTWGSKEHLTLPQWTLEIDSGPGARSPHGGPFHPGKGVLNIARFYQSPRDRSTPVAAVVTTIVNVFKTLLGVGS